MCQRRRKKDPSSTLPFHRAPPYLRSNPFIIKGYRSNLSTSQCFQSLFTWNNETLNVWSHVAGFLVFLGLLVYDVTYVFHQYKGTADDALVVAFVLLSFMLCMMMSSLYHTLNCRSEESCRRWLSYDIFGVSASFLAIFLSGIYYGFWCPEYLGLRNLYMGLVCCLFLGAMVFLLNPRFMGRDWDNTRVALFTGWALSGLLPLAHWIYIHGGLGPSIVQMFLPRIIIMYLISGAAVAVYLGKIPERYFPGRFDIVGASHQLWHLIIVVALVYWHQTGLHYAHFRLTYGCSTDLHLH
ncbi:progestin and adipoQ receptor family member 3-like [Eriocheir sinensis]|uniref:progestin and adipoQ receptor family member 3-like n=1 Tax=Eriocheir sinensis TaxID=95602 RepID=UPI0021C75158|nr:progestin and adipoQ receptor family member 3-like [Eriocheir sinensis]XP_050692761.1 progestin and adipoQ receptor family member 3-like [Eriocheir sinensis]XP_050692790.1 progestin and adipoQ receptor family member 3-like [Eriocheir sinensis]XP_050692791.1 progestin and adipoQ receptor family member 3-like [Eriocheir sinensis]